MPRLADERGFVLMLAVLMLFSISLVAAAGYVVLRFDLTMSHSTQHAAESASVARAGLHRFVAEQIGTVGDSVTYAIGDGNVTITSHKVMSKDSLTDLYYLEARASVSDPSELTVSASSVVGAYAWHHRRPLRHHAALVVSATDLQAYDGAVISGVDMASSSTCAGGGAAPIIGGVTKSTASAVGSGWFYGSPALRRWAGGHSEIYDSVGLRWDVLTDPSFPVDSEDVPPDYSTIPADSFPVVRYNGNLYAGGAWDGRGVLIVTGQFDSGPDHDWVGIVLAGWMDDIMQGNVYGLAIGGLSQDSPYYRVQWRGDARYYSCAVYAANESLSYMQLLENTIFEST